MLNISIQLTERSAQYLERGAEARGITPIEFATQVITHALPFIETWAESDENVAHAFGVVGYEMDYFSSIGGPALSDEEYSRELEEYMRRWEKSTQGSETYEPA